MLDLALATWGRPVMVSHALLSAPLGSMMTGMLLKLCAAPASLGTFLLLLDSR